MSTANPFSVQTPETMSAKDMVELFVPIVDYYNIESLGQHVFLNGHRGCGKSMMFRLMSPDCQMLVKKIDMVSLPFYGIYSSIKATDLDMPELQRLNDQAAGLIISEHLMVEYLANKALQSLQENCSEIIKEDGFRKETLAFCNKYIFQRLEESGWKTNVKIKDGLSAAAILDVAIDVLNQVHRDILKYVRKLAFETNIVPYQGILLGFYDFLLPLLKGIKELSFTPNGSIFLLIDDADNLNLQQTKVLNSWVSYRTTDIVCIKIATQLSYKTYFTASGQRIEAPHDYAEINISSIYTGSAKDKYPGWVKEVVDKRLNQYGIKSDAEHFFPADEEQEQKIAVIADEYKKKWQSADTGGSRARDDAYRYARPEYIKRLHKGNNYKYAGFNQLVHISSGIIRYFLDSSAAMYAEQFRIVKEDIHEIPPAIQDKIVREQANELMFGHFDKIELDIQTIFANQPERIQRMVKLKNLINTLGVFFYEMMISDRSERRIFSFAISDEPDQEIKDILKLGTQFGYIYEATIGNKDGRGRTKLYVLTRRVAPFFKLDPIGFSGYKFVTSRFIKAAMDRPKINETLLRQAIEENLKGDEQLILDLGATAA